MANNRPKASAVKQTRNYSHVIGGNPATGTGGPGTPVIHTSTGADFTHSTKRMPQTGHANGKPSPSGNW